MKIDAKDMTYRQLNSAILDAVESGNEEIELDNVIGQRYIGRGLDGNIIITINGTPGNDLGSFMNGAKIVVNGNAQDGIANTMNDGRIIIHGSVGDIIGYGMRGGKLYIKGNAGYRVGIHMKQYGEKVPVIIAGGTAADFFGEYMAGGIMILLGLGSDNGVVGDYVGTGMHGGVIYIRGGVDPCNTGKEVSVLRADDDDMKLISHYLKEYCDCFGFDFDEVMSKGFTKLVPMSHRPYGEMYVY
ncbi:MAG: hypothetical protein OIN89_11510 [Candidatus Methanoperedens sp.]|jgi:glutamate synthase domain-containing protein 3|nr:hypothetical protein [Candidatus Methanoperedens sp.]PKL52722.1 MAG: hypothetical protein CVV36_10955 [Candidatus Methanoperedenaceae archaeon HGW-Methanoperedenaceae-1]